jgi:hypothetical protein
MAMEEAKVLGRVWGLGEERERKAFAEGLTRADGDKWNIFDSSLMEAALESFSMKSVPGVMTFKSCVS